MTTHVPPIIRFWRICIGACIVLLLIPVVLRAVWKQGGDMWVWVHPPSLPAGFYSTSLVDSVQIGDPTVLCIPGTGGKIALDRDYSRNSLMSPFACPPRTAPMVKIIAGIPGDTIRVHPDSVRINSGPWLYAPMSNTDSKGRKMTWWTGEFVLSEKQCYALNLWSPLSYDSRYFGPFPCPTTPVRVATPISPIARAVVDSLGNQFRRGWDE